MAAATIIDTVFADVMRRPKVADAIDMLQQHIRRGFGIEAVYVPLTQFEAWSLRTLGKFYVEPLGYAKVGDEVAQVFPPQHFMSDTDFKFTRLSCDDPAKQRGPTIWCMLKVHPPLVVPCTSLFSVELSRR